MKRLTFYLVLATMFACGCSAIDEPDDAIQLSDARVTHLFTLDVPQQKIAFEILNAREKAQVWKMSVNNAPQLAQFNRKQRLVVQELLNFIGSEIPQDPRAIAAFERTWLEKAEKVMDEDDIYSIAYKINNGTPANLVDPNDPTSARCNCHRGSEWSCGPITVEWWCPDGPSNCKRPTKTGCGFMWLFSCNQVCVFQPL